MSGQNIDQPGLLLRRKRRDLDLLAAREGDEGGADGQKDRERSEPQQPGPDPHRRLEQDEVAVAADQIVANGLIRSSGGDLVTHQTAHVRGDARRAVGDGLMLADDAADVGEQSLGAGFLRRVRQGPIGRRGGLGGGEEDEGEREKEPTPKPFPSRGKGWDGVGAGCGRNGLGRRCRDRSTEPISGRR